MEKGTCPVCNGTLRVAYDGEPRWAGVTAGYDLGSNTVPCRNCGGQYMFGRPSGLVSIDYSGQPCVHDYIGRNAGRCLTEYTCKHCGERHQIDSGD